MKICTNCFKQIDESFNFCPYCGFPVKAIVTFKKCSQGHLNFPEWKTCPFCISAGEHTVLEAGLGQAQDRTVLEEAEMTVVEGADKTKLDEAGSETVAMTEEGPSFFAWLVLVKEGIPVQDYRLVKDKVFIGKDPSCDIVVDDEYASKLHAAIYFKEGSFEIDDLNSTNGTFVNGKKVDRQELADGDVIKVGRTEFLFKHLKI